jgi:hypothetical protein
MNNRIQELIQQSMPEIDWKARYGAELSSGERLEHMSDWFDKFAELIIKDCLDQCYNRGMNDELYAGQLKAAAYIEQYFGIK